MQIYAVIDTNVIVSALITKNPESPRIWCFVKYLTAESRLYIIRKS